jgi:hypothetical protein
MAEARVLFGKEPSESWGSSDDLVEATAGCRTRQACVLPRRRLRVRAAVSINQRRAIEFVGTDSIYSTGVAEGRQSMESRTLSMLNAVWRTSTARRGERLGRLGRSELHPDMT